MASGKRVKPQREALEMDRFIRQHSRAEFPGGRRWDWTLRIGPRTTALWQGDPILVHVPSDYREALWRLALRDIACRALLVMAKVCFFVVMAIWVFCSVWLGRPCSLFVAFVGTVATEAILYLVLRWRVVAVMRRELERLPCWACGYSTIGLKEPRCPECGTPYDPAVYAVIEEAIESGRRGDGGDRYSQDRGRAGVALSCRTSDSEHGAGEQGTDTVYEFQNRGRGAIRRGSVQAASEGDAGERLRVYGVRKAYIWRRGGPGPRDVIGRPLDRSPVSCVGYGPFVAWKRDSHLLMVRRPTMRQQIVGGVTLGVGAGLAVTGCYLLARCDLYVIGPVLLLLGSALTAKAVWTLLTREGILCKAVPRRVSLGRYAVNGTTLWTATVADDWQISYVRVTRKLQVNPGSDEADDVSARWVASVVLEHHDEICVASSGVRGEVGELAAKVADFWSVPCQRDEPLEPE